MNKKFIYNKNNNSVIDGISQEELDSMLSNYDNLSIDDKNFIDVVIYFYSEIKYPNSDGTFNINKIQ